MKQPLFGDRRKALEEEFFRNMEEARLQKLKDEHKKTETKKALQDISGIYEESIIDQLMELGFSPECFTALMLTPLVEVAWSDGKMDEKERKAILKASAKHGIKEGDASRVLLDGWLQHKPDVSLRRVWVDCVQAMTEKMTQAERIGLKVALMNRARSVAKAAGGFLGLGPKISHEEEMTLSELEEVFGS